MANTNPVSKHPSILKTWKAVWLFEFDEELDRAMSYAFSSTILETPMRIMKVSNKRTNSFDFFTFLKDTSDPFCMMNLS